MKTHEKSLHTHVITILFVLFQFIQFFPSSLISSLTASAETADSVTLFSDESGSGSAKWSVSPDGKEITWDVTIDQNESETEKSPVVEVTVPSDVGAPKLVSATPDGAFTASDSRYVFSAQSYSAPAQTLTLTFTNAVSDTTSPTLEFSIGGSVQEKEASESSPLQSVSIPNKLAQLELERIAAEKAEAERIAAEEKAEAKRIAAEKAAQEEADRLAAEEAAQDEADLKAEEKATNESLQEEIPEKSVEENQETSLPSESEKITEDVAKSEKPDEKKEDTSEEETPTNEFKEDVEEESEKEGIVGSIEEEYDPGDMLDGFPATEHPDNPTPIKRFAPGSLGSALTLQKSSESLMMQNTSDLEPGEVRTNKTATRVDGMVNTWDITVRIEGRDAQEVETTDVVLVIDRSGSMADNNRMQNAKDAANNFINTMIPQDPNLRIAVVSFASDFEGAQLVTINSAFSQDTNTLTAAVNSLNALGGTHTQAGILQGQSLLNGSGADNKYMVLLSDGQPTYSYEPQNWTVGLPSWGTSSGSRINTTAVYDGNFNTGTIVGTGSALTQSYNSGTNLRRHIHNGFAAIKAGEDARVGFDGLFTIAVEAGTTGTSILEDIASPGLAYSTDDPAELEEIYDEIGTQISTQFALRNVELTDEMGDGFSLIDGTLVTSEGNTSVDANDTITWTIDPGVQNLVEGTTDVRFAEMTYRIEINDSILDLDGAKTDDQKLFETNKITQLAYTDTDDQEQTIDITSPEVDPVLLKIKKILEGVEQDDRLFVVQVSNDEFNYNQTESLVPNDDYIWITTLRHEGIYDVGETSVTGPGMTDLDQFIISYEVDGDNKTSFEVNHVEGIPRGDVTIDVTNREIALIDLTATKIWVGGPEENKDPVTLTLWRTTDGTTLTEVEVTPDIVPPAGPANVFTYRWSELPLETNDGTEYTYYFTETEVDGYTREYNVSTEIENELYGTFVEFEGTVTNTYQIPTENIDATKTWINGENVRPELWYQLRRFTDNPTLSEAVEVMKLPAANETEETVSVTFSNVEQTDSDGNAYTFYVVEGTYDEETEEFTPGVPENFVQTGNGLALTNTYVIPTTTAQATKIWIGSETDKHVPVILTLWRTTGTSIEPEQVEVDPSVTPETETADAFYYEWINLEATDDAGNPYTYYFTEDEVLGFDRIYSDPTEFSGIEYQEAGGTVTNQQQTIDFSFTKVDEEGNPLEGSDFTLEREDDGTIITNDGVNPEFIFAGLTEGRYILTETKAPAGYNLPTTPWIIEVARNEETGELEIIIPDDSFLSVTAEGYRLENNAQSEFPQTGGIGVVSYLSFGMLAIFSSLGFYIKKEENGGY